MGPGQAPRMPCWAANPLTCARQRGLDVRRVPRLQRAPRVLQQRAAELEQAGVHAAVCPARVVGELRPRRRRGGQLRICWELCWRQCDARRGHARGKLVQQAPAGTDMTVTASQKARGRISSHAGTNMTLTANQKARGNYLVTREEPRRANLPEQARTPTLDCSVRDNNADSGAAKALRCPALSLPACLMRRGPLWARAAVVCELRAGGANASDQAQPTPQKPA
jgi:hypothetical protein